MLKYLTLIVATLSCITMNSQILPKPLRPGSKIAIVSPSSACDTAVIEEALDTLRAYGFEPVPYPNIYGKNWGSYPATDSAKIADLTNAFADPEIDAILCTRGGYGCTRLLPELDIAAIRANPKWLIGFSDISALHALMYKAGVVSIHGPMCKHLGSKPEYDESKAYLFQMLTQGLPMTYEMESNDFNKSGWGKGRLVGGNFIVVNNLAETPFDVFNIGKDEDIILFVEEVGEKIYAVERMLLRLHQSGALSQVKGIIFGEFTGYDPDEDFGSMEEMIHYWLNLWGYYDTEIPILYCFPAGHDEINFPLPMGALTTLTVDESGATITFE